MQTFIPTGRVLPPGAECFDESALKHPNEVQRNIPSSRSLLAQPSGGMTAVAMPWSFHTPTAHCNYQWEITFALSLRSCPQPGCGCSAKGNDPAEAIRRRKKQRPLFAMGVTGLAQQTCQPPFRRNQLHMKNAKMQMFQKKPQQTLPSHPNSP